MLNLEDLGDLNIITGEESYFLKSYINNSLNYGFHNTANCHYSLVPKEMEHYMALTDTRTIFLFTHSLDVIRSLPVLINTHPEKSIKVIRVNRSTRNSNKGELITTIFNADEIKECILLDIEMR